MSELSKHFTPNEVEDKWYSHWESSGFFKSKPDDREPFTIVIPPPNVTGVLHMGHMLNNTIQDVLIRHARKQGKNACWVPGTDHAAIATEAKVVRWLREDMGLTKSGVGREKFLDYANEWKDKYGGIILGQLRTLGASCDWDRTAYTMDEIRSKHVIQAFVDLYNAGKLYRGKRMVNWDPEAQTVLSNEEVLYNEENGHLYHLRYETKDGQSITIATTRPETILADAAVAVHPDDPRYADLIGQEVKIPLLERYIPVIADDYVDMEFGTGGLKITPAHDPNDFEIGKRHNLEVIDILNDDGSLNAEAQLEPLIGLDRKDARKKIAQMLEAAGYLSLKEDYRHKVGRSERTNAVIEPKLSLQWYVDMKQLVDPALKSVMEDVVKFVPSNQKNLYKHWMENIQDWCISRQLWLGHRIPAYFYGEEVYVATTIEEALAKAQAEHPDANITAADLKQDEDVLDTWFSSWLWPISLFDGFENQDELDYYYPTSVLVTGWDIIYLWVARMIMAGYEWKNEKPFDYVYFTGMVRDKQGRKMSKSLGNSPDALELMKNFGADGVRFGVLSSSPAGGDLLFDEKLCDQGKNFSNKMWQALRLYSGWETVENNPSEKNKLAVEWMQARMAAMVPSIHENMEQFKLSEALIQLYSLIWDDFCSWYLEFIKPGKDEKLEAWTKEATRKIFAELMSVLHPFMPFITEEISSHLQVENCIVAPYSIQTQANDQMLSQMEHLRSIIRNVRDMRNKSNIGQREALKFGMKPSAENDALFAVDGLQDLFQSMAYVNEIENDPSDVAGALAFIVGTDQYYVFAGAQMDVDAELERLEKELAYEQGFVQSVAKKLSNERFVNNAPEQVVQNERKKMEDGNERIRILEESIAALKG